MPCAASLRSLTSWVLPTRCLVEKRVGSYRWSALCRSWRRGRSYSNGSGRRRPPGQCRSPWRLRCHGSRQRSVSATRDGRRRCSCWAPRRCSSGSPRTGRGTLSADRARRGHRARRFHGRGHRGLGRLGGHHGGGRGGGSLRRVDSLDPGDLARRPRRIRARAPRLGPRTRGLAHATVEERQRIARELHDVVAHSLAVTMLNLTGARLALRRDPAAAEAALRQAEESGRQSMADIRRAVGLLGAKGELTPLPVAAASARSWTSSLVRASMSTSVSREI